MNNIPKVEYAATTLTLTLGQKPWAPFVRTLGGSGIVAGGAQAAYVQRRDQLVRVTLVFYEDELAGILTWLAWAQDNFSTPFDFFFDKNVAPSERQVYLDSPRVTEDVTPRRSSFVGAFEIDVTLRAVNGVAFTRAYIE